MKCEDIMKTGIACISPASSIQAAAAVMREANVGFLPVCEEGLQVVGIVTDRDITIRAVADGRPTSMAVEELMSRDVIACEADDELDFARELMAHHHKSRIVVVNRHGQLEGVISLSDIAQVNEASGIETLRHVSSREARGESTAIS